MFRKIITENSQEIIMKFVLFVFKHQRRLCIGTKIYHHWWPIVKEFVYCHKMFWIMIYFRNRTWKTNLKVLIKWLNNNGSGQRVVVVFYLYAHEMCNWCRFYYFLLLRVEVDQCCKCCWQTIVSYSLKKVCLISSTKSKSKVLKIYSRSMRSKNTKTQLPYLQQSSLPL